MARQDLGQESGSHESKITCHFGTSTTDNNVVPAPRRVLVLEGRVRHKALGGYLSHLGGLEAKTMGFRIREFPCQL